MGAKRYVYGMRLRGFSPGCQPKEGFLECRDDPQRKYHDLLVYDRMLTKEEKQDYELDFVATEEPDEAGGCNGDCCDITHLLK